MNIGALEALTREWREQAEMLRHRGADAQARALESCAEDHEERLRSWYLESLTLHDAAEESGIAYSTLQQKVATGDLPNSGEKGSPRILRCDLPSRGGRSTQTKGEPDLAGEILSVS